jgi:hypothetical protein
MTKRLLIIRTLILLGAIGVTTRFRPLIVRAAGPVTVLQPTRAFQIQGLDHWYLKDVAVYNGDLFLLLNEASGSNQIVRVTGQGEIVGKIPLPTSPQLQHFGQLRISQSGTLAVSYTHPNPDLTSTSLYDTDGVLKTSFDVAFFDEIAFLGDDLVGVGPNGITQLTSRSGFVPNGSRMPLAILDPSIAVLLTASLPQNRLAIVEPVAGRLQIATMDSLLVGPMVLYAPEIQGIERPSIENGWVAVISTVAANHAGSLFLGVTGGKRQEGAPVLQLDGAGVLKNRIKCVLPTFGQDPSDHESYMYPSKLLATNDSLFWISRSEKKVAIYFIGDLN